MKKQLFSAVLVVFGLASCTQNEVKTPPVSPNYPPVAAAQNQEPAPQNAPEKVAETPKPAPQKALEPLVNPSKMQNNGAAQPPKSSNQAAPAIHGTQPKLRPVLPDDAMCFIAKENSGKVSEIRLAMKDAKKMTGDLLVHNVQTREFAQGRLLGELRDQGQILLTWSFNDAENVRQIINLSYLLKGDRLTQKSRDPDDEGRVFSKVDCSVLK